MADVSNPVFLELAGLPASGKTTTASLLKQRLTKRGLRGTIVPEAAAESPLLHLKRDWRFNAWTLCQAVASVVEHADTEQHDVVVLDRGLLDALCWIKWFRLRSEIDTATASALESFALVPTWFRKTAVTVVLHVRFETALQRRGATGRIVNPRTFQELRRAYDGTVNELLQRELAKHVRMLETDDMSPDQVCQAVASLLMESRPEL